VTVLYVQVITEEVTSIFRQCR